jgi:hypothetical protein
MRPKAHFRSLAAAFVLALAAACGSTEQSSSSDGGACRLPDGQVCCSGDVVTPPICQGETATCPSGSRVAPNNQCVMYSEPDCAKALEGWAPQPYVRADARPTACSRAVLEDLWKTCFSKGISCNLHTSQGDASADAIRCAECIEWQGSTPYAPPFPSATPGGVNVSACADLKGTPECAKAMEAKRECTRFVCGDCRDAAKESCERMSGRCYAFTVEETKACDGPLRTTASICKKTRLDFVREVDDFIAYTSLFCGPL